MEENKNELMLWVGILCIIGIFIYFMPDIERFFYGQPKKDKESGEVEKAKQEEAKKQEAAKKEAEAKKKAAATIPTKYECTRSKTESYYKEDAKQTYTYDKKGNTLTVNGTIVIVLDNVESYNQMKTTYDGLSKMFDNLDIKFKDYYVSEAKFDDANRTITITSNVKDYANTMKMIEEYNKAHENETVSLTVYGTYSETEINMKSDGYTCK